MRITEACFKANLFAVKNYKKGSSPLLISKYVPPPLDPANTLYCIYIWSIEICKWEAGSKGGTYLKIEKR